MRDELLFFDLTQQDNDEVKIGKKTLYEQFNARNVECCSKSSSKFFPSHKCYQKTTFSEGFRVVYRGLFLLKVLLRIELVRENRKVLIWENPQIMGHPNVE